MSFTMLASRLAASWLGVDATWTSRLGGAAVAVRVMPASPEAGYAAGEGPSVSGIASSVVIAAAAIPGRPERLDLLTHGGIAYFVAEVVQDPRGVSYRLHLRRA